MRIKEKSQIAPFQTRLDSKSRAIHKNILDEGNGRCIIEKDGAGREQENQ